jgi:large subunit ribosomal protein L10
VRQGLDSLGPLLYAFSTEEPGAAGRLIKEFAKGNDKLQPQAGGQSAASSTGPAHVEVLASLPTREQALTMLASVLARARHHVRPRPVKAVATSRRGGDQPGGSRGKPKAA